jgi:hypothetical protein
MRCALGPVNCGATRRRALYLSSNRIVSVAGIAVRMCRYAPTTMKRTLIAALASTREVCSKLRPVLHVKWVPCHHGMARQVANVGGGLQIWRVAANSSLY